MSFPLDFRFHGCAEKFIYRFIGLCEKKSIWVKGLTPGLKILAWRLHEFTPKGSFWLK